MPKPWTFSYTIGIPANRDYHSLKLGKETWRSFSSLR